MKNSNLNKRENHIFSHFCNQNRSTVTFQSLKETSHRANLSGQTEIKWDLKRLFKKLGHKYTERGNFPSSDTSSYDPDHSDDSSSRDDSALEDSSSKGKRSMTRSSSKKT